MLHVRHFKNSLQNPFKLLSSFKYCLCTQNEVTLLESNRLCKIVRAFVPVYMQCKYLMATFYELWTQI